MQPQMGHVAQCLSGSSGKLFSPGPQPAKVVRTMPKDRPIDELDAGIVEVLTEEPRIGVLECSRRLGVARGTVQARLDRLQERGVIRGFGPEVDPAALGYGVMAFVTLE